MELQLDPLQQKVGIVFDKPFLFYAYIRQLY